MCSAMYRFMPLTIDMTTIRVVVAITTPSKVRKLRSLWLRNASSAIQKASRAVTQMLEPRLSFLATSLNYRPFSAAAKQTCIPSQTVFSER